MTIPIDTQRAPWARWMVGVVTAVALLLVLAAPIAASGDATAHAWFHVTFSLVGIMPAMVLALRCPRGGPGSTAPMLGFVVLAGAQLLEGFGALGFAPDGYGRANGLVALHDLGLIAAPIGMIAGAVGVAVGIARLVSGRTNRPLLTLGIAVIVLVPLLYLIAKLMGI